MTSSLASPNATITVEPGSATTIDLPGVGVAGTYGSGPLGMVPVLTLDAYGRVIAASQRQVTTISGVTVSGVPVAGEVLTATSPTAATWILPNSPPILTPTGFGGASEAFVFTARAVGVNTTGSVVQPMMSQYSGLSLVSDWEFNTISAFSQMTSGGVWVNDAVNTHLGVTPSASNISFNGTGMVFTLANAGSGAGINTNPSSSNYPGGSGGEGAGTTNPGYTVAIPFYREVAVIFTENSSGQYANWPASWMLGLNNATEIWAEVDWPEVNNSVGHAYANMHFGGANNNGNQASCCDVGVLSAGVHKFGVYVTASSCTFYLDYALAPVGDSQGNPMPWNNLSGAPGNLPSGAVFYLLHSLDNGQYGGPQLVGGTYTIVYDRVWR